MIEFCKISEWEKDYLDTRIVEFYQTQTLALAGCCSKAIIILCHSLEKLFGRIDIMDLLLLREIFIAVLLHLPIFLVNVLEKLKSTNSKVNCQRCNPMVNRDIRLNKCL